MITESEIRALRRGLRNGAICSLALWALLALVIGLYPFVATL